MHRARQERLVGQAAACGTAFLALCLWNADRSYAFDEAVTIGNFVSEPNVVDAVTEQLVFNNQPLLTAANWVVRQVGGTSEVWQRMPAAVAGALCVALCVRYVGRRGGHTVATAATFLACPLLLELGREARGYSLVALFAAASTVLLVQRPLGDERRWLWYGACVAGGLLSHLHFAAVVVGHGSALWVRPAERRPWIRATIVGGALASLVYLPMLPEFRANREERPSRFLAGFPIDVVEAVFGTPLAAVAGTALVAVVVPRCFTARRISVGAAAFLAVVWVGLRPHDLYPRFVVWAVPLLALAIGTAAVRRRPLTAAVLAVAVLAAPHTARVLDEEPTIRAVSDDLRTIEAAGFEVCALGHVWQPLQAYVDTPPAAIAPDCEVYVASVADIDHLDIGDRAAAALVSDGTFCVIGPPRALALVGTGARCPTR